MAYERFVDDRLLTSRDALNRTQIKIKLVEIDEAARDFSQRFGNRVLVRKILLTIRLTQTEEIEEKELNIEEIETLGIDMVFCSFLITRVFLVSWIIIPSHELEIFGDPYLI